jgi:hypothetical protein
MEPSMDDNLAWIIVAIGVWMGGLMMIFGFRKADVKPASDRFKGALKQDWTPTGNIDFHASTLESSTPQPLRLWVEEKRITETPVGQRVAELRWRLATIGEGRELVICWNARQTTALLPQPLPVDPEPLETPFTAPPVAGIR